MSGTPAGALREAVFAGAFWGKAVAASEVAEFVASADAGRHLLAWFGADWLAWLRAQPDRRRQIGHWPERPAWQPQV